MTGRFQPWALLIAGGLLAAPALAQDPTPSPVDTPAPKAAPETIKPKAVARDARGARKVQLSAGEIDLYKLLVWSADLHQKNFIIADRKELEGKKVTFISHQKVSLGAAWEAFLSALEVNGFTLTQTGANAYRVVKVQEASQTPLRVNTSLDQLYPSEQIVTQLVQLTNISVNDITKVITTLAPPEAKIVAYAPTNTLIMTDTAINLRKILKVAKELDVAAPKAKLQIVKLQYAEASEVKRLIEELYGTAESSDPSDGAASARSRRNTRRTRRGRNAKAEPAETESVTAGKQAKYIDKILDDERTNSLIVLANDDGMMAVMDLVQKLDVDITPRSQIHVVYLEHAKAEDVAKVLSDLAQSASGVAKQSKGSNNRRNTRNNPRNGRAANPRGRGGVAGDAAGEDGDSGAIAAFEDMHITADENTNSLIILAAPDAFGTIKSVIDKLDIVRRQVFVDAVILELASDDAFELGKAIHGPLRPNNKTVGFVGGQFGTQSLGLSQDLLSGLAVGVFGESIDVPLADGTTLPIPAFGVVLNALKSNSSVNIVSNPNLLTLDNQEAKIVVGRKIPFPTTSGLNSLGQPVVSFQREDVAITLKVTPRINSSNFVTLELEVEVQEIEEDSQGLDVNQAGFITSKRQVETTALVRDNQTVVLGGLLGTTETRVETKVPVLGDLPLIGALFRGSREKSRKSTLMVFLTPHIIDDVEDMYEVQRVKEAQRQEFMRRFYGRSRDQQIGEMNRLLQYSMNQVDQPSMFRGPTTVSQDLSPIGEPVSNETREAIQAELDAAREASESRAPLPDDTGEPLPEGE